MFEQIRKLRELAILSVRINNWFEKLSQSSEYRDAIAESTPLLQEIIACDEGIDQILPLDATLKNQFERAFGVDLSTVKIHLGSYANKLASNSEAMAITIGSDIYFAAGKYNPYTEEGLNLLAHELQHTIQFGNNKRMEYIEDLHELENEASKVEDQLNEFRLHNIEQPLLDQSNIPGIQQTEMSNNKVEALKKGKLTTKFDSLDDFRKRSDAPIYKIHFCGSGKTYCLTENQREQVIQLSIEKIKKYITDKKMELTTEEYEKYVLKFVNFLTN